MPPHRPASPAELGDLVRAAAAAGHALFPAGGGTQADLGLSPDREGVAVDLAGLDRLIDYPAADMTVTAQAGLRVAELRRTLAEQNQRLPLDVPLPHLATLGGSLAADVSGSRRLGCGTARDYVIGITVVNDRGHEAKAGGRVVKNVAGYDLCKLHVGALGTLGVVSQVTLKVRPRPEAQAVLTFGCGEGEWQLAKVLDGLHASRTRPTCLDVVNPSAVSALRAGGLTLPEAPWVVLVGYEDGEAAVNWQLQQLIRELTPSGLIGVEARAGAVVDPLWQSVTDFALWPEAVLSLKANLRPSRAAAFCLAADALPERPAVHAHAGSGIVRAHFTEGFTCERADAILKGLLGAAGDDGNIVLTRCPAEWKPRLPVWGRPRGDAWLMRQVKQALDPGRLFNPGRFIDGL